ncbi:MAG: DUF1015 domain-containing protein [Thermotogae bacterium]|nr:DUF1015 domain-containing protein [Thermotogota bacterium]
MAVVKPFRAYRYAPNIIEDMTSVVTQPYDKIDDEMQVEYYKRSKYNIIRVIKGKRFTDDSEQNNVYTRAAKYLREWIERGILIRDSKPSIYIYDQEYKDDMGRRLTRKGFIALGKLEEYSESGVKPHERTLSKPKEDRFNLMKATNANFGQVFMLYTDPEKKIDRLLARFREEEPDMKALDWQGEIHKLWKVEDAEMIQKIEGYMKDKTLLIADGHHRYETALNYKRYMIEKIGKTVENAPFFYRMMTFVNTEDEGLTIFPTHRLIFNCDRDVKTFLDTLKRDFFIEEIQFFPEDKFEELERLKMRMRERHSKEKEHVFGLYLKGIGSYFLLTLKNTKRMDELIPDASDAYKSLDVVILHKLILEDILRIDAEKLKEQMNIDYERYLDEAVRRVDANDKYQMLFILNPARIENVKGTAEAGERMPQKSTDFYPKLLTGFTINLLAKE